MRLVEADLRAGEDAATVLTEQPKVEGIGERRPQVDRLIQEASDPWVDGGIVGDPVEAGGIRDALDDHLPTHPVLVPAPLSLT